MRFFRNVRHAAVLSGSVLLGLTAQAGSAAAESIIMSAGTSDWDFVMMEGGVAEKYGLTIEFTPTKSGVDVPEAIVSNSVNVASIGETPLASLLPKTDLVAAIGTAVSTDGSYAKVIVRKDAPFTTIDDLKGKNIATKIGSGSYRALVNWCELNNCSINDFNILNTSPGAILAAIEGGSVDAGIWFAPTTTIAVSKGFGRILMDFKGAADGQASWIVNRQYAEEHPETVAKFLAATIDAQTILTDDPDRAAELIEQGLRKRGRDLPAEIIEAGFPDFDYTPNMDIERKVRVLEGVWDSLVAAGKVRGDMPDFTKAMDPTYFERAEELVAEHKN